MYNDDIKFSLWCDFIERDFIAKEFGEFLAKGTFNGATSNPSIFKNAITTSQAYGAQKAKFAHKNTKKLYEILAITDIKNAANALLANYAKGDDGFISIEVDPSISGDAAAMIKEGKRLFAQIAMPNVMIKVPATQAGYETMRALTRRGINVNATLIFSPEQTAKCLEAIKEGTSEFAAKFEGAKLPQSVISIFVSRFDRALDEDMKKAGLEPAKIGIMNATKCYNIIAKENLPFVRALFASTGVKGGEIPADYYIKELLYPLSVNTAPLDTIKAFIGAKCEPKTPFGDEEIDKFFADVAQKAGIDMDKIYKKLLKDGLVAFEQAFDEIMTTLKKEK
ncbi:transaldolase [Campylobacter sp. JMF_01 NE2]|uniref:transaldolase n=1 Tax=unclassified Campylobacter TaxID=2593542 RepID=UPI0022E9B702|nr:MULTISPECIES: transaldolase [unclassified Campylobacter]MDA3053407.1 transaldolase [Campylobacter sp. JMF_03 NE3]MDA3067687.1 transaldolase [Campylobacter sp. JMF_01 NE2]